MANFNLSKLAVDRGKTQPYTFPISLGPDPTKRVVFHCVPAGLNNRALVNDSLKESKRRGAGHAQGAEALDVNIEVVAATWPRHVIRGWDNVVDSDTGQPVPFSPEEATKLILAIAAIDIDYVTDFTSWAQKLENWRDQDQVVAKN